MKKLLDYIADFYAETEYPALAAQMKRWQKTRPLAGKKILDATPVFRNTMVKYAALLTGGADLTVSVGKDIPCDIKTVEILSQFGIRVADDKILKENFDAVADCAGRHIQVNSTFGYAELTRSGLEYYKNCQQPVFSVDSGILKHFETTLGTGESFVRAMKHLGFNQFHGKTIIVFGGGKVGKGTAFFAAEAGAETFIIDKKEITPPPGVTFVKADDSTAIKKLLSHAWCIISATGLPGVLAHYVSLLQNNTMLIANMGVEDEFGPLLPSNRVLNNKRPLNFLLEEPTRMTYIDPSMALSNEALLLLINCELASGISSPSNELEMQIIGDMRKNSSMDDEINLILKEFGR